MNNLVNEIWKEIPDYENYKVSNLGRVKSLKFGKEKILKNCTDSNGYLSICLSRDSKQHRYRIHRLVYESFKGKIPEELVINHIDENIKNNRLTNLEAITPVENSMYGTRLKRISKSLTNNSKISKSIQQVDKSTGNTIKEYPSLREASRQTGIGSGNISQCCSGKYKTAGGYIWKYK